MTKTLAQHQATILDYERAARGRDQMIADIQRRSDWGPWFGDETAGNMTGLTDLTERYRQAEGSELPQDGGDEIQRRIDALLAEQPPEWLEFARWGVFLGLWLFAILAICILIAG